MKNFFRKIKNSCYDQVFYKNLESQSLKKSLMDFTKFNLFAALLFTIFFTILISVSFVLLFRQSNIDNLIKIIPQDLELTVKDGRVMTNVEEPYSVPMVGDLINSNPDISKNYKNLFTIDTKKDFNLDNFNKSQSLIFITKDYLVYKESGGQIRMQPLKDVPNMIISRVNVSNFIIKFLPYIKVLALPLIFVGLYVSFFVYSFIANILFISIMSLIIFLVFKIKKESLDFVLIYKYSLYLIVPVIILNLFLFIVFGYNLPWYVDALALLCLYQLNLKTLFK